MLFTEIYKELENRKYLYRRAWQDGKSNPRQYIAIVPGFTQIRSFVNDYMNPIRSWDMLFEDLIADDWEMV